MTYIGYLNRFWTAHEEYLFSSTAIALYVYLLNECNRRNWKMPFPCSTVVICDKLHVCKTALTTARKQLAVAGLIEFTDGRSRYTPSKYILLERTDNLTVKRTDDRRYIIIKIKTTEQPRERRSSRRLLMSSLIWLYA